MGWITSDGEVSEALLAGLSDNGIVGLGFAKGGFRHMINNTRPVATPDDVDEVKYRVMQKPVFIEMFRALGGNAVPMAWGEEYTAVQQGTIDGPEIHVAVIQSNTFAEVVQYLSLTRHTYSALGVLLAERTFNDLSAEDQAAVKAATALAVKRQRAQVAANVTTIIEALKADGMEVNEVEDPAQFQSLVFPVYDQFRDNIGANLMGKGLATVE